MAYHGKKDVLEIRAEKKFESGFGSVMYISRLMKQHNSVVSVIPKGIRNALDLHHGDVVVFELKVGKGLAVFRLLQKGVIGRERSKGHSG